MFVKSKKKTKTQEKSTTWLWKQYKTLSAFLRKIFANNILIIYQVKAFN